MPSAGVYRCAGGALARSLLRASGGACRFMSCDWDTGRQKFHEETTYLIEIPKESNHKPS